VLATMKRPRFSEKSSYITTVKYSLEIPPASEDNSFSKVTLISYIKMT